MAELCVAEAWRMTVAALIARCGVGSILMRSRLREPVQGVPFAAVPVFRNCAFSPGILDLGSFYVLRSSYCSVHTVISVCTEQAMRIALQQCAVQYFVLLLCMYVHKPCVGGDKS